MTLYSIVLEEKMMEPIKKFIIHKNDINTDFYINKSQSAKTKLSYVSIMKAKSPV